MTSSQDCADNSTDVARAGGPSLNWVFGYLLGGIWHSLTTKAQCMNCVEEEGEAQPVRRTGGVRGPERPGNQLCDGPLAWP